MEGSFQVKILVIEDDLNLACLLREYLGGLRYGVKIAIKGKDGLRYALSNIYDLILMDIGLPDSNGLGLIEKIRSQGVEVPIIVITSLLGDQNELNTYANGANLFHEKPIDYELLLNQIKMLLKNKPIDHGLMIGNLDIDFGKHLIKKGKKVISLTSHEFKLLELLVSKKGHTLSREKIIASAFNNNAQVTPGAVDALVSRTRKKLGQYQGEYIIETVYREGYRINPKFI